MDEIKKNAVYSQISSIKFRIIALDEKLKNQEISQEEYELEIQKMNHEIDLLEQTIQYKELPKDYTPSPAFLEVDVMDYLWKHKLETSAMKDAGKPIIEVEKRLNEEEGIEKMVNYIKEKGLMVNKYALWNK